MKTKGGLYIAKESTGSIFVPNKIDGRSGQAVKSVSELIQVLEIFLNTCMSQRETRKIIEKMLVGARLKDNILTFSFPGNIRQKMLLARAYKVALSPGQPTITILPKLAKHLNLCHCKVKTTGLPSGDVYRVRRIIKNMLLKAEPGSVSKISLSYIQGRYNIRLKFTRRKGVSLKNYEDLAKILKDAKRHL